VGGCIFRDIASPLCRGNMLSRRTPFLFSLTANFPHPCVLPADKQRGNPQPMAIHMQAIYQYYEGDLLRAPAAVLYAEPKQEKHICMKVRTRVAASKISFNCNVIALHIKDTLFILSIMYHRYSVHLSSNDSPSMLYPVLPNNIACVERTYM